MSCVVCVFAMHYKEYRPHFVSDVPFALSNPDRAVQAEHKQISRTADVQYVVLKVVNQNLSEARP